MDTILAINLVATSPAVRNGRPHLVGTTITVADVAIAKVFWMMEADAIADYYELSLPQVYAALAYYYEYKDDINANIATQRQVATSMKEQRIGSRHPALFR